MIMKKLLTILLMCILVLSGTPAHAGDAWPWVVGGLAGAALLTSVANSHHNHHSYSTSSYYYTPSYYPEYTSTYHSGYHYSAPSYWNPYVSDIYGYPVYDEYYSPYGVTYYSY